MSWPHSTPQTIQPPFSADFATPQIISIVPPHRTEDHPSIVLTASSISLFDHSDSVLLASHERSKQSVEKYGENVEARYNFEDTLCVVRTTKMFLLVYVILPPEGDSNDDELLSVYTGQGTLLQNGGVVEKSQGFFQSNPLESPIMKYQLRFKLFLKITHGIRAYLPLSKWEMLLVTANNFQMLNLADDGHTIMNGLSGAGDVCDLVALTRNDTLVIMNDGAVQLIKKKTEYSMEKLELSGAQQIAVNKHFELLAVTTESKVILYNYATKQTVKELDVQAQKIQWSKDGLTLLAIHQDKTWSLISTFGCTTFHSGDEDLDSPWLNKITTGTILPHAVLLSDSSRIYHQPLLKQLSLNSQTNHNIKNPILISGAEVHIYTGDNATANSVNWNIIKIPMDYYKQLHNTVTYASISPNGKYLALANRRSLLLHSFITKEWFFYINDYNHDLHLSQLTWHDELELLIVANKTTIHSELVVFDMRRFEGQFDSDYVVFRYKFNGDLLALNCVDAGKELLLLTSEDKYYHFQLSFEHGLRINLVKILGMPLKEKNLRSVIRFAGEDMLLLNGGELVMFRNKGSSYEKLLLFDKVEYVYKLNDEEFYLFNGSDLLLVRDLKELSVLSVPCESYPLGLSMERGTFVTLENSLMKKRTMELNTLSTKNSIFLHDLMRFDLKSKSVEEVYHKYKGYKNLAYCLELLLYQTVIHDEDLTKIVQLLKLNPVHELNVVSKCLRKIEMTYWDRLLGALGTTPKQLLERSIELEQFKTLGVLVIIFLNYQDNLKIDGDQLIKILQLLYQNANDDEELWETAFEMLRFMKLLDSSLLQRCILTN